MACTRRRRDQRRRADDLPHPRLAAAGPPDAGHPLGRRRHRLARPGAARSPSASRSRASTSTSSPSTSGCSAATASSPRDRSGRRSTRRATTGSRNLTAIFDVNRLGQRGPTEYRVGPRRLPPARRGVRLQADRHRRARPRRDRRRAFRQAREDGDRPTVIIAKTIKGKGFQEIENKDGWHGKALPPDMAEKAIAELGGMRDLRIDVRPPPERRIRVATSQPLRPSRCRPTPSATRSRRAKPMATRCVRSAPAPTSSRSTARSSNSTHADEFKAAYPDRFFEMFIAEQQMVASAVGFCVRGYIAFASTFAAFFSPRLRLHPHGGRLRGRTSGCAAPTRAARSAPTALRRWRSKTSRRCARSTARRCSIRATRVSGQARRADGRPRRHQLHPHDARRVSLIYGNARSSRSADRRWSVRATTTRSR